MNQSSIDEHWMRVALNLGQRGLGQVWPNPAVGCVLVKNARVLARGRTQSGGRPHAEAHALKQAGPNAKGSTAYVTLEPCSHQGETGPCANALVAAGVVRVVSACADPDPRVNGKGHSILRKAGLNVVENLLSADAQTSHLGFFTYVIHKRPMVTLKLASSLDGRIATRKGDSKWITGPEARRHVHLMRARHDAILVGRGTVAADDPELTVRNPGLSEYSPMRVVLDSNLSLPASGRLAKTADRVPLIICHSHSHEHSRRCKDWKQAGAQTLACSTDNGGQLDIADVLARLGNMGITRLMVEGGGHVAASLMRTNLVDRLVLFCAGVAVGADGVPNLASFGVENLADAPRFHQQSVRVLGRDIMSEWASRAALGITGQL